MALGNKVKTPLRVVKIVFVMQHEANNRKRSTSLQSSDINKYGKVM